MNRVIYIVELAAVAACLYWAGKYVIYQWMGD